MKYKIESKEEFKTALDSMIKGFTNGYPQEGFILCPSLYKYANDLTEGGMYSGFNVGFQSGGLPIGAIILR